MKTFYINKTANNHVNEYINTIGFGYSENNVTAGMLFLRIFNK